MNKSTPEYKKECCGFCTKGGETEIYSCKKCPCHFPLTTEGECEHEFIEGELMEIGKEGIGCKKCITEWVKVSPQDTPVGGKKPLGEFGGYRIHGKSYDPEGKEINEKHNEDCFCCRKNLCSPPESTGWGGGSVKNVQTRCWDCREDLEGNCYYCGRDMLSPKLKDKGETFNKENLIKVEEPEEEKECGKCNAPLLYAMLEDKIYQEAESLLIERIKEEVEKLETQKFLDKRVQVFDFVKIDSVLSLPILQSNSKDK